MNLAQLLRDPNAPATPQDKPKSSVMDRKDVSKARTNLYKSGVKNREELRDRQRSKQMEETKKRKSIIHDKRRPGLEAIQDDDDNSSDVDGEVERPKPKLDPLPTERTNPKPVGKLSALERLRLFKESKAKKKEEEKKKVQRQPFKVGVYKLDGKFKRFDKKTSSTPLGQKWQPMVRHEFKFKSEDAKPVQKEKAKPKAILKSNKAPPAKKETLKAQISNLKSRVGLKRKPTRAENIESDKKIKKVTKSIPDHNVKRKVPENGKSALTTRGGAKKSLRFAEKEREEINDAIQLTFGNDCSPVKEKLLTPMKPSLKSSTNLTPALQAMKINGKQQQNPPTPLRRSARISRMFDNPPVSETSMHEESQRSPPKNIKLATPLRRSARLSQVLDNFAKQTSHSTSQLDLETEDDSNSDEEEENQDQENFKPVTMTPSKLNFNFVGINSGANGFKFSAKKSIDDSVVFLTPTTSAAKKRVRRSEVGKLMDPLRHDINFFRGSTSDKKKKRFGINPYENLETENVRRGFGFLDDIPDDSNSPAYKKLENLFKTSSGLTPDVLNKKIDRIITAEKRRSSLLANKSISGKNLCDEFEDMADSDEVKDVTHFRNLLKTESDRLNTLCEKWEAKMEPGDLAITEDVAGQIRSVIGKARLLMNKKGRFEQFAKLIDDCQFDRGERKTTCTDLQGFWEMIYRQVEDIDSNFKQLDALQANNWVQEEKIKEDVENLKPAKRKAGLTKPNPSPNKKMAKASASLKELMAQRRMQMKGNATTSIAIEEPKQIQDLKEEEKVFEGGFFKVRSPLRKLTPKDGNTPSRHEKCTSSSQLRPQQLTIDDA